jgi:hypothetical protein
MILNWLPVPPDFPGSLRKALDTTDSAERLDKLASLAQYRLSFVETIQLGRALSELVLKPMRGFSHLRLTNPGLVDSRPFGASNPSRWTAARVADRCLCRSIWAISTGGAGRQHPSSPSRPANGAVLSDGSRANRQNPNHSERVRSRRGDYAVG